MEFRKIKHIRNNEYEIPENYLPTHYFDVFNTLYRYENLLRLFTYSVLKAAHGNNWVSCTVKETAEGQRTTIDSLYKRRKNELMNYGHISELPNIPLLYFTLDDLISLITNPSNAILFSGHFPASLSNVYKPKFWEILISRNHLTHFRKLKAVDIDRLTINLGDVLNPIENYLKELIDPPYITYAPTKEDDYYPFWTSILMKEKKYTLLAMQSNKKKSWIKIIVGFKNRFIGTLSNSAGVEFLYEAEIDMDMLANQLSPILTHTVYYMNLILMTRVVSEESETDEDGVTPNFNEGSLEHLGYKIELVFPSQGFLNKYEEILSFIMELIDRVEKEYSEANVDFGVADSSSLKYLKIREEPIDSDDANPDMDASNNFDEECRKAEDEGRLKEFMKRYEMFTRKDIPEDWTFLWWGKKKSLLNGDMPWLV